MGPEVRPNVSKPTAGHSGNVARHWTIPKTFQLYVIIIRRTARDANTTDRAFSVVFLLFFFVFLTENDLLLTTIDPFQFIV